MIVSRNVKPKTVRFPKDIEDFFIQEAFDEGRSFNSEVMRVLKNEMEARIEKKKQKHAA
ncbi:hypothetical protein [Tolumonas lignilytica]|uniref:hypothetical protein n=1 Tax=Tolumonas lignilytica TaxID=1283284 RepID=UPI0013786D2B|nr:hypothetical protein [Tolumonas lignilytica]